jgi:lysozyme
MSERSYADIARDLVKLHEGKILKVYTDTLGNLTIGYGRALDRKGISADEAEMLLERDLRDADAAARVFAGEAWDSLADQRKAVLVDMAHNLGGPGLMRFVKLRAALRAGDYAGASTQMLDSKWASQVGARATRLAKMMRTGLA